jgi:hypothetical protein
MDWDLAIERNRLPLLAIVLALFAELGLTGDGRVERLSKPLYRTALRLLRKAESAVRRLIYVAARNIVLEPGEARPSRPRQKPSATAKPAGNGQDIAKARRKRRPQFTLFDPLKRFARRFKKKRRRPEPRIRVLGEPLSPWERMMREFGRPQAPPPPPPAPPVEETIDDGMVDARKLIRRFLALTDALQDIPRQALRLARWQARPKEERRPERWSPLRVGRPPGFRQRAKHEVDEILKDCDWLARNVMPPLNDTS